MHVVQQPFMVAATCTHELIQAVFVLKQTFSIKTLECDENDAVNDAPSTCNHDQESHDSDNESHDSDNDACSSNSEEVCIQLIYNEYSALHVNSFIQLTRVVLCVILGI